MASITFEQGRSVVGHSPARVGSVSTLQTYSTIGATSGQQTRKDAVYQVEKTEEKLTDLTVTFTPGSLGGDAEYTSLSPSVGTVSSSGVVSRVTDGMCSVQVTTPHNTWLVNGEVKKTGGAEALTFVSIVPGSLFAYLSNQQELLCNAATPGVSQRFYVNGDGSGGINPNQWTNAIGIAGYDPFDPSMGGLVNQGDGLSGGGTWLSEHHLLRGIGTKHTVPHSPPSGINVGADMVLTWGNKPAGAPIVPLMPANWKSFLPTLSGVVPIGIPVWCCMRNVYNGEYERVVPVDLQYGGNSILAPSTSFPVGTLRDDFCPTTGGGARTICTGGDSGSPVFVGIQGTLVMLGRVHSYGGGIDAYGDWIAPLTEAMNTLALANGDSTPYSIQTFDIGAAGFPQY